MSDCCKPCRLRQTARNEDISALKRYCPQMTSHSDEALEELYAEWSRSRGADWLFVNDSSRYNFTYWFRLRWSLGNLPDSV